MAKKDIERKSFMFYLDWEKQLDLLEDEQVRRFVYNLIRFHNDEEIILESKLEEAIWNDVSRALEINHQKYIKRVMANRENGRRGGRPPDNKNPENPNGFSENPKNPIIDNREEINEKSKKINENGEEEIDNGEELIDDGKQKIVRSKLTKEKIEELIDDSKKLNDYLNERIGELLSFDKSIIEEINPNNIGEDIITNNEIESYFSIIEESWNSNIKFSQRHQKIIDIEIKIYHILLKHFTQENIELLKHFQFDKVPQYLLTKNNFKLFQFYRNIELFLADIEKIEKEMSQITL